ncbi:MAG: tetratricopeptide repeat protein [Rikenellaceae bacterium]
MKHIRYIIVCSLLLLCALPLSAHEHHEHEHAPVEQRDTLLTVSQLWDMANTAYTNGKYAEAMKLYEAMEQRDMRGASLLYNKGNAYFKMGEIGEALLCYNRALKFDPSNKDIRYNIEVVRAHTTDNIDEIPEFILSAWSDAIRSSLSFRGWAIFSIIALTLTLASILLFMFSRGEARRRIGGYGAIVSAVVLLFSGIYTVSSFSELHGEPNNAIVMMQSVAVKSSPASNSTDLFILHEGTTVKVLSVIDNAWSEIKIADGKQGWVESKALGFY